MNEPLFFHLKSSPAYHFIKIPCKPFIRKYVHSVYGDPVPVSLKNEIGVIVKLCLDKNLYLEEKISESFIHRYYTDHFHVKLSRKEWIALGFSIAPPKIHIINSFAESLFERHLYYYCDAGVTNGKTRVQCIEEFADRYDIIMDCDASETVDISFEGLKKMEMRYRARDGRPPNYDILFSTLERKHRLLVKKIP